MDVILFFPLNCQTNAIWNSLFDMRTQQFWGFLFYLRPRSLCSSPHHRIFGMHKFLLKEMEMAMESGPLPIRNTRDRWIFRLARDAAMEILDHWTSILKFPSSYKHALPLLLVYNPHQVPSTINSISYIFFNQLFRLSEAWHHQHCPPGMVLLEFLLRVLKQCSEPATASTRSFVACCSASDDSLCVS